MSKDIQADGSHLGDSSSDISNILAKLYIHVLFSRWKNCVRRLRTDCSKRWIYSEIHVLVKFNKTSLRDFSFSLYWEIIVILLMWSLKAVTFNVRIIAVSKSPKRGNEMETC